MRPVKPASAGCCYAKRRRARERRGGGGDESIHALRTFYDSAFLDVLGLTEEQIDVLPVRKWRQHRSYVDWRLGLKAPDDEEWDE